MANTPSNRALNKQPALKARLGSARTPSGFLLIALFGLLGAAGAQAADLTVQIGAFGIKPNADFTEQAGEYGEVLVLRGDDGVTRVSIGRYDSKVAANAALARLQLAGYTDAYITNVRGRGVTQGTTLSSSTASSSAPAISRPAPAASTTPTTSSTPSAPRTIVNPSTASSQRLPSGRQIVTPKQSAQATDESAAQAGRFRLRTHDTSSGETTDLNVGNAAGGSPAQSESRGVVAGMGVSDIPPHLRDKLVYLDGVPHIKDGDRFIPLTDAVDGQ